ncbi:MAG: hypothetical protein P9L99_10900 [Candidatus Lernaella stagnicola]|nr:hypothetical protein [Candidatus Lernaella stagnicola]
MIEPGTRQNKIHGVLIANLTAGLLAAAATWFLWIPFVYHMALIVLREIFPWFIWYKPYERVSSEIIDNDLWKPLPFLFLATFFLLRRAGYAIAGIRRGKKPWTVGRVFRTLLAAAVLVPSAAYFLVPFAFTAHYQIRTFPPTGHFLQRQKCSLCHPADRPFHYMKESAQWRLTVERMRESNGAPIDGEQAETIIAYLARKNTYDDASLFRAKCRRCHGSDVLERRERTAAEWELIVNRMQHLSAFAYREEWARQLRRYAAEHLAAATGDAGRADKILFERRCGRCHQLDRVRVPEALSPGVAVVVERMAAKVPGMIAADEAARLADFVPALPDDAAEFRSLFPHDRLVEATW